jgi:hypothetical protein
MAASFQDFVKAAGKEPFSLLNSSVECYRLNVKCSWLNHQIVRIERTGDSDGVLVAHWMGNGDRNWGYTIKAPLEARHWRCLEAIVEFSNFWALPEYGGGGGFDGAFYTVEARKSGSQHRVCRWSPGARDQESFSFLCDFLVHLAKLIHERPDEPFPWIKFDIPVIRTMEAIERSGT